MAIHPLPPGTLLYETRTERGHRFRVEGLLGQGGFGITYLATDSEFGGPCVIKEFALGEFCARTESTGSITAAPGRDGEYQRWIDRFEREAHAIHRIQHANVIRVRASWRERGTAYYAMDLVPDARELPSPDEEGWQSMPWARAEQIALGMLSALHAVHTAGLIHGDIKPSNVLLDPADRPVLIDFGTVRTQSDLARTITGAVYTPGYAPPELSARADLQQAGPWSDLYSWAMVVWGLVAPHPSPDGRPLDAATRQIVASAGGVDRYPVGAGVLQAAGVAPAWLGTLLACVELDPRRRPPNAAAILAHLSQSSGHVAVSPADARRNAGMVEEPTLREATPRGVDGEPAPTEVSAALHAQGFRYETSERMTSWLQRACRDVSLTELKAESARLGMPGNWVIPLFAPLHAFGSLARVGALVAAAGALALQWIAIHDFRHVFTDYETHEWNFAAHAMMLSVCGAIAAAAGRAVIVSGILDRSARARGRTRWALAPLVPWTGVVALASRTDGGFVPILLCATVVLSCFAVGLPESIRRSIQRDWIVAASVVYGANGARHLFDQRLRTEGTAWILEACPWLPVPDVASAVRRARRQRGGVRH